MYAVLECLYLQPHSAFVIPLPLHLVLFALHQITLQLIALLNGIDERTQGFETDFWLPGYILGQAV